MNCSLPDDWLYDTVMLQLLGTTATKVQEKKTACIMAHWCVYISVSIACGSKKHHHL